jgi:single-strand DNA-binding protein
MTDLNHVILEGRLTRDLGADERSFGYVQSGMARANISIAVNRSKKDANGQYVDEVSYFDVVIWGKTAENLKPYLTKGKQILVDGALKQERWQDRQTGENRSRVVINTSTVQLLGGNQNNQQNQGFNPNKVYNSAPEAAQAAQYQNRQPGPAPSQDDLGIQEDLPYDFPDSIPF